MEMFLFMVFWMSLVTAIIGSFAGIACSGMPSACVVPFYVLWVVVAGYGGGAVWCWLEERGEQRKKASQKENEFTRYAKGWWKL